MKSCATCVHWDNASEFQMRSDGMAPCAMTEIVYGLARFPNSLALSSNSDVKNVLFTFPDYCCSQYDSRIENHED